MSRRGGSQPARRGGFAVWDGGDPEVQVHFAGRGAKDAGREEVLSAVATEVPPPLAWARQVHSAKVLDASPGVCGEGDALVAEGAGVALTVVTADCVPVLLAGPRRIAAVHAGWRGIVAGVVPAAVERLEDDAPARAWIGPAIGPCCYEVNSEVAQQVVAASAPEALRPAPPGSDRPHLHLAAAVAAQLRSAGVEDITDVDVCTRCRPDLLWSYRGQGSGSGRNLSFIWRR